MRLAKRSALGYIILANFVEHKDNAFEFSFLSCFVLERLNPSVRIWYFPCHDRDEPLPHRQSYFALFDRRQL